MRLRLVKDGTKAASNVQERAKILGKGEVQVADDEISRQLLTFSHGAACACFLVNKFRRKRDPKGKDLGRGTLRQRRYFVVSLFQDQELPMWLALALRFLASREARWSIEEHVARGTRFFTVRYLRPKTTRGHRAHAHLKLVR